MSDIFVSYSRLDAAVAGRIVSALKASGFDVWIDSSGIEGGRHYDREIESALNDAKCALVLWSQSSVQSEWVRTEASEGLAQGKLIPVLLEPVQQPLQFRNVQAIDFQGWEGSRSAASFEQLRLAVQRHVRDTGPSNTPSEPRSAPARWRQLLESMSIAFADKDKERRFDAFFIERYMAQIRMYLVLVACLFGAFAIFDYLGAQADNGFQIVEILGTPLMIIGFLVSLWPPILRVWRACIFIYTVAGMAVILWAFVKFGYTIPEQLTGTLVIAAFGPILVFVGLVPMRLPESAVATLIPVVVAWFVLPTVPHFQYVTGNMEVITGIYLMVLIASWWREKNARRWFLETRGHVPTKA